MFPDKNDYISEHIVLDKKTGEQDLKDFSFTFIELPKFKKESVSELTSEIEKWCYFFKHASEPGSINELIEHSHDANIKDAYNALEAHNWSEMELRLYDNIQKRNWDNAARERLVREEGLQEGLQKGKQEAIQEIAKKLLSNGFSTDQVKQMTGLSASEIESLQRG